eukprot:m.929048 g.929048  ORF g.929048 m.929048 type:complete len:330 (-) comp23781_c0_seq1:377-1366(-)
MSQQFKMKKPTTAQFVEQILSLFFGLLLFSETHASEYCTSDSCIEAEDLSVAQLGADKQLSHKVRIPFVPFPKPPVTEPWVQGHESGIQLQNGNAVSEVDVPNLGDIPTECPELRKPTNVHFMVINLDRSINRRRRMRSAFMELELPMFERVPGVLVTDATVDSMHPKRLSTSLKLADYGCALAHRRAWQRVVDGDHEWVVIIEDDAELVESVNYTDLPAVPTDADLVLFRAGTIMRWAPVCEATSVMRAYWGFGMVAYLVSKDGAQRLLDSTSGGLRSPLDGHIWYQNAVYSTRTDYIWHPPCSNPCPSSVRTWLNGELPQDIRFPDD